MDDRIIQIQKLLDAADGNLSSARTIMRELTSDEALPLDIDKKLENVNAPTSEGTVVEGVFDGEQMVASEGKTYPVPPNYASKSKLVEGDTLKLTIADDGSFVFKQIQPVERRNAIGTLAMTDGNYTVSAEGKSFKVLTASVTFYKAEPGDQVTIILPKEHEAFWAVLENVIKKGIEPQVDDDEPVVAEKVIAEPVVDTPAEAIPVTPPVVDETPSNIPEAPMAPPVGIPEIEFPAGAPTISDEQLLENLKNNLKNLDQPTFTPPETVSTTPKQVDNIVASELDGLNTKDKPIAELDI